MSIRTRLALSYAAGFAVTLLIASVIVWWQMGLALHDSLETALATRATSVIGTLENSGQSGLQETDQEAPGVFAALFTTDGSLSDATSDAPSGLHPLNGVLGIDGHQYLLRTTTALDGTVVVTGADLRQAEEAQAALARLLIAIGVLVGTGSLIGGWLLAGRALRPVDRLISDAANLGTGDLRRRLTAPVRADEIGQLTMMLNRMLDRIAESVDVQRLFVAMAAHELRTPLAALQLELELVERADATLADYRRAVREARGDAIRLSQLATSLLEVATSREDAARIERGPVDVRQLTSTVVLGLQPLARQRGVTISLDVPDLLVSVDRTRIENALGNLIGNALIHGARGSEVEVRCRAEADDGMSLITFEVLDRGAGIGEDPPEGLFEPFVRGRKAVGPGSGLGLATVASAARAHGGAFGAGNRNGGGARFWFTIHSEEVRARTVASIE